MQKIKNSIVDRMIAQKCTANEINFLIYVSAYQDITGRVTGVHYKDVCDATGMSIQGYYDTKASLEEKGFIVCEKCDYSDCDITIVGNAYDGEKYNRGGYINTSHNIFSQNEFYQLKAGAKLLALKLLIISFSGKGFFEIGVKKFYDKENGYQTRFGVGKRVMRSYLMSLKPFFSIVIKDGKYYITPKKNVHKNATSGAEVERYREKAVEVVLRRNRIKETGTGKEELYNLFKQYDAKAETEGIHLVSLMDRVVKKSLEIINQGKTWIKYKIVNIKLIHKLLRENWSQPYKQKEPMPGSYELPELTPQGTGFAELYYQATHPGNQCTSDQRQRYKIKFNNFKQRNYDFEALERMLLLNDVPESSTSKA